MAQRISLAGPQSDVQGRMTTGTVGTGTLVLGAAASGATTFAAMPVPIADGDVVTYELIDIGVTPIAKEKGRGTYHAAGPTLSRDTVIWSTNGNARLNLSGNASVFVSADDSDLMLLASSPTLRCLFRAHLTGDQSCPAAVGSVPTVTKIAFNVVDLDLPGGNYSAANQRWTPPAGTVHIQLNALATGFTSTESYGLRINKNGSAIPNIIAQDVMKVAGGFMVGFAIVFDEANGTDFYEAYIANTGPHALNLNSFPGNTTWSAAMWPGP